MGARVRLNEVFVNKLDSICFDLKYYINVNSELGKSLGETFDDETVENMCLTQDDLSELILLRTRLMELTGKLKFKVKNQNK